MTSNLTSIDFSEAKMEVATPDETFREQMSLLLFLMDLWLGLEGLLKMAFLLYFVKGLPMFCQPFIS